MTNKKEITISHHDRQIRGIYYIPQNKEKYPIVIFSHGFGGVGVDFERYAVLMAENGIAAITYDFCGGSSRSKSSGKTSEMSVLTEKEDLCAVIDEVRTWEEVEEENLFLFGESQGGLVTALTIDEREDQIRAVMLIYPALCIEDDWAKTYPNLEEVPDEFDFWGTNLGKCYVEALRGFDTYSHIGKYAKKVFMMHGDKDPIVNISYSERLVKMYPDAVLEVFPGEGHGFSEEGSLRAREMCVEFVQKNIME